MTNDADLKQTTSSEPPPINPQPQDWYYAANGDRLGPFTKAQMGELLRKNEISSTSLVWKAGMADWKPLARTEIITEQDTTSPPPLPASAIDNRLAWLLAFVPLIGSLIENAIPAPSPGSVFAGYFLINSAICFGDERLVKKSGHLPKGKNILMFFWLIPLYLYQRAKALGQSLTYMWVWIALFILSIFLSQPDLLSGNTYYGTNLPTCNSSYAQKQVIKIFNDIPLLKNQAVAALDLQNVKETSSSEKMKSCSANVRTTAGTTLFLTYTISQTDDDKIYIRVQVIP